MQLQALVHSNANSTREFSIKPHGQLKVKYKLRILKKKKGKKNVENFMNQFNIWANYDWLNTVLIIELFYARQT